MHPFVGIGMFAVAVGIAAGVATAGSDRAPSPEVRAAYDAFVSADHWRDANAALDQLLAYGNDALGVLLEGTDHEKRSVRQLCYEALQEKFPDHPRAQNATVDGLKDDEPRIRYICAFYLGGRPDLEPAASLRACILDPDSDAETRYAAAKSLAELGDADVIPLLFIGLGSEIPYVRYLSNIGVNALAGKDLGDFGYDSPWEGAFVSGPNVGHARGQPIEKAARRVERWAAIRAFAEWLASDKPDLFRRLEASWLQESWILDELRTAAETAASTD